MPAARKATACAAAAGPQLLAHCVQEKLARASDKRIRDTYTCYFKSTIPLHGVSYPHRRQILNEVIASAAGDRHTPTTAAQFVDNVAALWALEHRESKLSAVDYAKLFHGRFASVGLVPLYERMIREGAWWDFIDDIAPNLIGDLLVRHPTAMKKIVRQWIRDDHMWVRRAAIVCQLSLKDKTDLELLFELVRARCHEEEFFIRKAIGWSLRQCARTYRADIVKFLKAHGDALSDLSFNEAVKHIHEVPKRPSKREQKKNAQKKRAREE